MSQNIRALLVGVNDYSPAVGRLTGCVNDVDHFHDFLKDNFDPGALNVEVLKDADATRANIIGMFRSHLCKASADDVVIFQYCGHGARWKSASEFAEFYPEGKDEGLVCIDSREPGGFDLADKELAVLLAEVARSDPHIAVILDSCHSGSATRSADDFTQLKARQTHEIYEERPLASYLDGYYSKLLDRGETLEIPPSRHVLLAACERFQKAWEGKDNSGVFTSTLLDVLDGQGPAISYADLFMRCRAMVRKRADNQDPQFETFRGFNAYGGFLNDRVANASRHFPVYFDSGDGWQVDCGALHGLPSDPDKRVELTLYSGSDRSAAVGHAETTDVAPQKSTLELLDFEGDKSARYEAEISSLPVPPLVVCLQGDAEGSTAFEGFLAYSQDSSLGVALLRDAGEAARYSLSAENGCYLLRLQETGKLIQGAEGYTSEAAQYMFSVLKRVADWERAVVMQNSATKMNPDDVQFRLAEVLDDDSQHVYTDSEITLDICREDDVWKGVGITLKANNTTQQALHFVLFMFSQDYGYQPMYNDRIEPTADDFTIPLNGHPINSLGLDDDEGDEVVYTFKLLVSTEHVDHFQFGQEPLELGKIRSSGSTRGFSFGSPKKKVHKNEWFTKDIRVKLARQLDRVSSNDAPLAKSRIVIKGHPSLQAGISLAAAGGAARGVGGGSNIHRALERQGMELLNFSGTRGDSESVLELTDIQNPEVLRQNPLEIELDVPLSDDEFILPLTFDGDHILLTGDPSVDDNGRTHISIDDIPDVPDNRRSLGKALKLYFFKTYLRRDSVNELRWVKYEADGSCQRVSSGVADKVAAATNIALMIHGIIGDTEGMAQGMKLATDAAGTSLDQKFDLVLTYDYENLSTPIAETAVALRKQLEAVGLHAQDDKRLTIIAHSMGGLVSRWFIEKEGGNQVVDHLAMFGTPNAGSPFGRIDSARKLSGALTTVAINTFPAMAPFGGALIYLLNRSKKLTPTLEQMHPESEFIKALNASIDPGIRYTIVAGDTREYREGLSDLVPQLLAKLGGGVLFDTLYQKAGHDIAVSDESIRGVDDSRSPPPRKELVVCHHLNYFVSEPGLNVMGSLDW